MRCAGLMAIRVLVRRMLAGALFRTKGIRLCVCVARTVWFFGYSANKQKTNRHCAERAERELARAYRDCGITKSCYQRAWCCWWCGGVPSLRVCRAQFTRSTLNVRACLVCVSLCLSYPRTDSSSSSLLSASSMLHTNRQRGHRAHKNGEWSVRVESLGVLN